MEKLPGPEIPGAQEVTVSKGSEGGGSGRAAETNIPGVEVVNSPPDTEAALNAAIEAAEAGRAKETPAAESKKDSSSDSHGSEKEGETTGAGAPGGRIAKFFKKGWGAIKGIFKASIAAMLAGTGFLLEKIPTSAKGGGGSGGHKPAAAKSSHGSGGGGGGGGSKKESHGGGGHH